MSDKKHIYNLCFYLAGSQAPSHARSQAYRSADAFLLCYKVTDPSTLFSALNFWCAEIRAEAPAAPIILVGCQSDLRRDREVLASLAKRGKAPISAPQALTFSQQINAQMYVETSARVAPRNAVSAFEVAALASMGKLKPTAPPPIPAKPNIAGLSSPSSSSTPSPRTTKKQRFSSVSPGNSLERSEEDAPVQNQHQFWDQFQSPQLTGGRSPASSSAADCPKTPSLGSHHSRSASLSSKTRSSTSIPSITSYGGSKTPKSFRRSSKTLSNRGSNAENGVAAVGEKMITIKCQRLTADKTYEEIEVEVPAPIYETIQLYNDASAAGSLAARTKERRSFGSKLKNLFTSSKAN